MSVSDLIDLQRQGDVFVLTMAAGENRWNTTFVRALDKALDEVMDSHGAVALVTPSLESIRETAIDVAESHLRVGQNRDVLGRTKERIYGENAVINNVHGAAHMLKHSRHFSGQMGQAGLSQGAIMIDQSSGDTHDRQRS